MLYKIDYTSKFVILYMWYTSALCVW